MAWLQLQCHLRAEGWLTRLTSLTLTKQHDTTGVHVRATGLQSDSSDVTRLILALLLCHNTQNTILKHPMTYYMCLKRLMNCGPQKKGAAILPKTPRSAATPSPWALLIGRWAHDSCGNYRLDCKSSMLSIWSLSVYFTHKSVSHENYSHYSYWPSHKPAVRRKAMHSRTLHENKLGSLMNQDIQAVSRETRMQVQTSRWVVSVRIPGS